MTDPGTYYAESRRRLTSLLRDAPAEAHVVDVAACPGWQVRDVVAHLVGTVEDALAGRITGPPSEEQTAEQVARRAGQPLAAMLDEWDATASGFEEVLTTFEIWPGAIDVHSHEQDIRAALGQPGARDTAFVRFMGRRLIEWLHASTTVVADLDGDEVRSKPADGELHLATTPFEVFRLRLGRRSVDQVRALDWSADPSAILDELFIFGPAAEALVE